MNQSPFFRLAIVLLVLLPANISAARSQEIGAQLYSFRNQIPQDIPGTLQQIRAMGIREIEGGGSYGLPMADYKAMLDKMGFDMVSIGADFDQLQKDLPAVIREAKAFGARYVVCFWIPHKGDDFTIEDARKAVEVFNAAGKTLKENGLSLCYHPHGYEFRPYENGTLFDFLAAGLNPAWVNFEMDVFWIKHPGQDPVALLKKYPGRFLLMHLKDRARGTPGNDGGHADVETNVVLGTGDVGIEAIMKQARMSGVKHFFIEDESSRSMDQVPKSIAFLKSLK
ncbi:MAG: sugar phosphate isomerase/epimerase [Chitinophagaceae bacterium]|jgi:sugar phosphate isomerase/epimerase|nr:sugar phosphate isomerase/epimerase [Chitinophagaceae bacterium]